MKVNYKNKEAKIDTQKNIETLPKNGEKEKNEMEDEKKMHLNKENVIPKNINISIYFIYQIKIKRIIFIFLILIVLINSISTSILNKKVFYNKRILGDDPDNPESGTEPDPEPDPDPEPEPEPETTERVKRPQEIRIKVSNNGEQQLIWQQFDNYSNYAVEFSFFDENDNVLESNGFKVNVLNSSKAIKIKLDDILFSLHNMFRYLTNIEEIDLSNFDNSEVTDMNGTFNGCKYLKKIN